jgi:hypothetical protein
VEFYLPQALDCARSFDPSREPAFAAAGLQ